MWAVIGTSWFLITRDGHIIFHINLYLVDDLFWAVTETGRTDAAKLCKFPSSYVIVLILISNDDECMQKIVSHLLAHRRILKFMRGN